jgi:hypothetical protein
MQKDLMGNTEYTAEDLMKMEDKKVEEAGFCPNCADEGFKIKLIPESGCEKCPRCGWSPCKAG